MIPKSLETDMAPTPEETDMDSASEVAEPNNPLKVVETLDIRQDSPPGEASPFPLIFGSLMAQPSPAAISPSTPLPDPFASRLVWHAESSRSKQPSYPTSSKKTALGAQGHQTSSIPNTLWEAAGIEFDQRTITRRGKLFPLLLAMT